MRFSRLGRQCARGFQATSVAFFTSIACIADPVFPIPAFFPSPFFLFLLFLPFLESHT